ncbi:MAG TPA: prolyl oligopeptidase family serine peptidase [Thermoanaerobaculia bacterium]|nr:prolyl oligopeptidase family serine peptidase [Thermoanaerobaculia bacterium]
MSFDEVRIAPDGGRLAYVARRNDFEHDREAFSLWVLDLAAKTADPVRLADLAACSALRWSPDGRALSFLGADDPAAGAQLFLVEPTSGAKPRRLTDPASFENGVDFYDWLPDGTGLVAVATDAPDAAALAAKRALRGFYGDVRRLVDSPLPPPSLYRVPRTGGPAEKIGAVPFELPLDLQVSADGRWAAVNGDDRSEVASSNQVELLPLGGPATAAKAPASPRRRTAGAFYKEGMAWAGDDLFVIGQGKEQAGRFVFTEGRLYRMGAEGRLVPVAPGMEGYLKQIVPLPDGSLLVTANVSTVMRVSRVEPASGAVRTLREQRGWLANLSVSRDGKVIAFVTTDPRHFPEIYVASGLEGVASARPVTGINASLTAEPQPEVETFSWDDGAGGTVEGALFWPPGRKGEKGLPLVVDLHGGPFSVARTEAVSLQGSFLSFPALLAARGFLVLNPNYRGSAGRGDAFVQGIVGHRCSRPSEDVIRGVESLVARGWADRQRVGLIGYSGGGGLSKCLIGRTDLFRAACTGAGVWDDLALYGTPRGQMWAEAFYGSVKPWDDFALWWHESPVSGLGRVKTPTLIVAGESDGEAPRQADELYRGLVARGVPTESLVFPGEGHVFTRPSHKRTLMRAEISWLEHYLLGKPRAELSEIKP